MQGRLQVSGHIYFDQRHRCESKTQVQKCSLQLITFAKCCLDKRQRRSPEETSLGNHMSSWFLVQEGSAFSKSVSIEGIVAKRWEGNSSTRGRTRKSKFLPWSTFPAHKNRLSKVFRGQAQKSANKLSMPLMHKARCERRTCTCLLTEGDFPTASPSLTQISDSSVRRR